MTYMEVMQFAYGFIFLVSSLRPLPLLYDFKEVPCVRLQNCILALFSPA